MGPVLEIKNISKHFTGVQALDDVSFNCYPGEVHILQGENGAGKSTMLKIISGVYKQDKGKITYGGQDFNFGNPWDARDKGISMVYQELTVLPDLTVAQNIFLNQEFNSKNNRKSIFINEQKLQANATALANKYDIKIDPYALIRDLSIADQQMVEILKALATDPQIIIFDEPTSALSKKEVNKLYEIIQDLKQQGKIIIFISHRMNEVFLFGDKATVLKDGKYIVTLELKSVTVEEVVRNMVGREMRDVFPKKQKAAIEQVILSAKDIVVDKKVRKVSFDVKRGEILGIAGLMGQGQLELLRALAGVIKISSGIVSINGKIVKYSSPEKAISNGIVYIPEDRKTQGLCIEMGVRQNIAMSSLKYRQCLGFINKKEEVETVNRSIKLLNIKTPSIDQYAKNLSGGNQQKVVIAKGLEAHPKILIFNEPTRGIDVESKEELYRLIRQESNKGIGILLFSSDMIEIIGLCDRVLTIYEGKITGELRGAEITEEAIMRRAVNI